MKLELIMPHYDEPWSVAKPFFDMLCCQKGIDFGEIRVRIVHDGTKAFPEETFSGMPFRVIQHEIPHGGVSAARNYGLDQADAEWVCFCDTDDTYSGMYSLKMIFDVLGTKNHDMLWGDFFVERVEKGQFILEDNPNYNMVWIHNKYFRLAFLRKIGLKFNEDLYFCEDSAFLALFNLEADQDRVGKIKSRFPLYSWCWREGSATTSKALIVKNIEGHFDRNCYVYEEFAKRKHEDADAMAMRTVTDAYIYFQRPDNPKISPEFEARVWAFYAAHREAISALTPETVGRVMMASEKEAKQNGMLNPNRPPIDVWLAELEKKHTKG